MMTVMHLYSVRKRVKLLRRLGALRKWLDLHILMGILGPLFVVLHSSFKVGGLVSISFWSMVAVALSGVFGRYLYLQIPRTRAGEELTLAEVERADRDLAQRLRDEFGADDAFLERLDARLRAAVLRGPGPAAALAAGGGPGPRAAGCARWRVAPGPAAGPRARAGRRWSARRRCCAGASFCGTRSTGSSTTGT